MFSKCQAKLHREVWGARELEREVTFQWATDTLLRWCRSLRDVRVFQKHLSHPWDACAHELYPSDWAWRHLRRFPQFLLVPYPALNTLLCPELLYDYQTWLCFIFALFLQFYGIAFEHSIPQSGEDSLCIHFSLRKLLKNLLPTFFFSWLNSPRDPSHILLSPPFFCFSLVPNPLPSLRIF